MKVSLMYIRAGGGHLCAARALAEELKRIYGNKAEPLPFDGLTEAHKVVRDTIEKGYRVSTNYLPHIWKTIVVLGGFKNVRRLAVNFMSKRVETYIRKHILAEHPDRIVILHFWLIKPVLDVLKEENLKVPVTVIVTDPFTCHPIWFTMPNVRFIVFSMKARECAIRNGVPQDNITISPIILNEKFSKRLSPRQVSRLKKRYGFPQDKKIILLAGGGEGIPRGEEYLRSLLASDIDAQLVIVCGRNETLKNEATRLKKRYPQRQLAIYGYVDFMYELMSMADLVLTKGGPATIMEVLMLHKPLIITSYIWQQEKGNVQFVERSKLGFYEPNPKRMVEKVKLLLYNEDFLRGFRYNVSKLHMSNGTTEVARSIWAYPVNSN